MAAVASGKDKLLRHARIVFGPYNLSGDARTISSAELGFGEAPNWGWDNRVQTLVSSGNRMAGIRGFQALINDDTGRSAAALAVTDVNYYPVSLFLGGGGDPACPDPAYTIDGIGIGNAASFDSGIGVFSCDFLPVAGGADANPLGVTLLYQGLTATTNGASHDAGAATANGFICSLHITASSGGEWEFVLQDSADDSSWTTLGTFTLDGSEVSAEAISGTGAVKRYVRLQATRTSGTCTVAVAFSRNW